MTHAALGLSGATTKTSPISAITAIKAQVRAETPSSFVTKIKGFNVFIFYYF
jgi:hypothetical protein